MPTQANAEHDPQHQSQDLLQSQAVEQIHPEQLLSVAHVFDQQQEKGNQPQTLISQELDALTMNKGFLVKAQKKPVNDEKDEILLAELLDYSKDIKEANRKGGYQNASNKILDKARNRADAKFEKAYGTKNFAITLLSILNDRIDDVFGFIRDGQEAAVEALNGKYKEADDRKKHYQSVFMASINILNTFIPIGASALITALEKTLTKKYLGALANPDLVTKIRLPQWGENIRSFGATAYRSAVVSTIGQIRGLWKGSKSSWTENVQSANNTLRQLSKYAMHHLMLKMGQEALEATPINLNDPDNPDLRTDIEVAIKDAILGSIFPNLAKYNIMGSKADDGNAITHFAKQQFLAETFFYGGKLDKDGEVTHKAYKPKGEVSEYALSALQEMPPKKYKEQDKDKSSPDITNLTPKDAYQTIETITQGPYDLAYQNMRSTLQYMGLDYNFTPDYHRGLRQSNTLGEKNWRLGIKIVNMVQLRQAFKEGFPSWAVGSGLEYPQRESFTLKGDDIYHIRRQALSPIKGDSGSVYLDFSKTNFGDIWVHTNRQDILAAKKGNIKDIRSFKLLFAASGPVFTINDLDHAGSKTYGPKNISGKYQLQVIL